MIRPKNKAEVLLLFNNKNCETHNIDQTHTQSQETLEFKLTQPKETFSFTPSIILGFDSNWMLRLTSIEVHNSFFNLTEEDNKLEFCTDKFDEFSFQELKDELEEILSISDLTQSYLQNETIGTRIQAYRKKPSENKHWLLYCFNIGLC